MSTTYTSGLAAASARTSGIASQAITSTSHYGGSAIDNSSNLDFYLDLEVLYSFASSPTAGTNLQFYLLYAPGGTTYEDGFPGTNDGSHAASPPPQPTSLVGAISVTADTSSHRAVLKGIPLRPYKFEIVVFNNGTGQTATVTINATSSKEQTIG